MSTLIESLEEMAKRDTKVRAVLKRSLAFNPCSYPPAFPYVEYRLSKEDGDWKRTVYYLIAGLWATHWREGRGGSLHLASACGDFYSISDHSPSVEKRFISLLDSDEAQLINRLRQMIALLKDFPIDFDALREDLIGWNHSEKYVQRRWAKIFYRSTSENTNEPATTSTKES